MRRTPSIASRAAFHRLSALVSLFLFAGCPLPAWAGKAGGGGTPPVDSGSIYYTIPDNVQGLMHLWRMKPDGTAKTRLLTVPIEGREDVFEPSKARHGQQRWFLRLQTMDGTYPDPGGSMPSPWLRRELFAISEMGDQVQLTDDPTFQPNDTYGTAVGHAHPRWALSDEGTTDGRVTLVGRRWNSEGTAIAEIGLFAVEFDPESLPANSGGNLGLIPARLPVNVVVSYFEYYGTIYGDAASVHGYDWSPSGRQVVVAQPGEDLKIADLDTLQSVTLVPEAPPEAASPRNPRWSPVLASGQTQVLFALNTVVGLSIQRINADGSGRVTVVPPYNPNSSKRSLSDAACWSPAGTCFLYGNFTTYQGVAEFYRVTADGLSPQCLTKNVTESCSFRGWTAP